MQVRKRFKGLDLIDRVPDELWTEVCDTVQETESKTIPKRKKCKKVKWLSEEALQITVKRREVKSKGDKKRYTHLNARFQRIARKDKKAFLSDKCKEIEENNRMRKTRDRFKKIRDTREHFTRDGLNKRKKCYGPERSRRGGKNTQKELYKKHLHDPDNHDGVITHIGPEILECEVKWVLGNIPTNKVSAGDGIPAELLQILKDDAMKVLHSICQQICKTQQWPQDWKRAVFIPIPKKSNAKE